MKRLMILLTVVLLIVSTVLSVYFSNKKKDLLSIEDQLPKSNLHEHTAPDGTVVQHQHTYEVVDLPDNVAKPPKVSDTSYPIQRAWERLDLEFIRRKYQPYTVAEMHEKWSAGYRGKFGPNYPHYLDEAYPQDEWLEHNLSLGEPLSSWSDYDMVLSRRIYMVKHKNEWQTGGENRKEYMRSALDLPSYIDTWEEYEDAYLKFFIVSSNASRQADELDPNIEGGTTRTDGTFIPFKENTVYAHIDPETGISRFTGVILDEKEEEALTMYGVAPKGITVIYTDRKGNPLPMDMPNPRFYERNMRELAKSQALLQQQIADHEFLLELDTIPGVSGTAERSSSDPQRPPSRVKSLPPLHTQADMDRWFTALETLHGGKMPRDLQALRNVITELEQIRQDAEKHLNPPSRPDRPALKENSHPPPENN